MLSRLALNKSIAPRAVVTLARQVQTSAVSKNEERDLVNFPRPKRPINPPKVRLGFLPDEWFTAFYNKTGVTGPYMLTAGLVTICFSKEFYVIEHEFFNGLSLILMLTIIAKKYGSSIGAYLDKEIEQKDAAAREFRDGSMKELQKSIDGEKHSQWQAEGNMMVFDAKKENVALQLENAYRKRLVEVHTAVKNKLDYQLEVNEVKTRVEQEHMVDWIVKSVKSSITPEQEAAALKKCFADLKVMAKA